MDAQVRIGTSREFKLRHAVLVYGDGSGAFCTLHKVRTEDGTAPYLEPAQPLSTAFLRKLAEGLGRRMAPEVLPENVLARTPDLIVWWSRASRRVMFFSGGTEEARSLNGHVYSHPALIFKVNGHSLFVRALGDDSRPDARTPLKTAPYWNTRQDNGLVCMGTTRLPDSNSADSIVEWEQTFFRSSFTHAYGAVRLTSFPGGFTALWDHLASGARIFPVNFLTDANQTLRDFVEEECEN
ncbi:MAG: PRTRC system protein B [Terriglobia bacterium]